LDRVSTACDSGWVRSPQAGSKLNYGLLGKAPLNCVPHCN